MTLSETLYSIAYCIFIVGAARSYRDNGSLLSVLIMSCGVLIDFLVSMLPMAGTSALKMNLPGTNVVILFAIGFGFIVWLLFLAALWPQNRPHTSLSLHYNSNADCLVHRLYSFSLRNL